MPAPRIVVQPKRSDCCVVATPIGRIAIDVDDDGHHCQSLSFLPSHVTLIAAQSPLSKQVAQELERYFSDPSDTTFKFSFPLKIEGTSLRQKIWQMLRKIPVGTTVTYGELAKKLRTSPRVIGNACRSNKFIIAIPCHRVVAVNGLGGYAGETIGQALKIKQWLLDRERGIK